MNKAKSNSMTVSKSIILLLAFIVFFVITSVITKVTFEKHYKHLHEAVEITAIINDIKVEEYRDFNDNLHTEYIAYLTYAYNGKIYENIKYTTPVSVFEEEGDELKVKILNSKPTEFFNENTGDVYLTICSAFFVFIVVTIVAVILAKKSEKQSYPLQITAKTVWQDTKPPMNVSIVMMSQSLSLFLLSVLSGKCIKPFYIGNLVVYSITIILLIFQVKAAKKYSMADYIFTRDLNYLANISQKTNNSKIFTPQEGQSYLLLLDKNYVPVHVYEENRFQFAYEYNEEYAKKLPALQFVHAIISSIMISALFILYCMFVLKIF